MELNSTASSKGSRLLFKQVRDIFHLSCGYSRDDGAGAVGVDDAVESSAAVSVHGGLAGGGRGEAAPLHTRVTPPEYLQQPVNMICGQPINFVQAVSSCVNTTKLVSLAYAIS